MALHKHQFVTYRAWNGCGARFSAVVRCAHRDGSVAIEAHHELNEKGDIVGPYLGFLYRVSNDKVRHEQSSP